MKWTKHSLVTVQFIDWNTSKPLTESSIRTNEDFCWLPLIWVVSWIMFYASVRNSQWICQLQPTFLLFNPTPTIYQQLSRCDSIKLKSIFTMKVVQTAKQSEQTLQVTIFWDSQPFVSNILNQQWQNIHCFGRIAAIVCLHNLFSLILDEKVTKENDVEQKKKENWHFSDERKLGASGKKRIYCC